VTALGETDGKGLLDRGSTPLASTKKDIAPSKEGAMSFLVRARGVVRLTVPGTISEIEEEDFPETL